MTFGEIRKYVSQTDAISIMLTSIGDVDENYINIEFVPDKYDYFEVVGFGCVTGIRVDDIDTLLNGTEFLLDDNFIVTVLL